MQFLDKVIVVPGLLDKVQRPFLERCHRQAHITERSDHDHSRRIVQTAAAHYTVQPEQAVLSVQLIGPKVHVQQHRIHIARTDKRRDKLRVTHCHYSLEHALEHNLKRTQNRRIIINHKNLSVCHNMGKILN